jgi:hypothetical protein
MKYGIKILGLILFSALCSYAQNIELLSLGSGELPVFLKGTTKDDAGNYYHFGDFKGAFTKGQDTLLFGNGGNDLFIYKTDANGQTIWAKNYGLGGSEFAISRLFHHGGALYGIFRTTSKTSISDIEIDLINNGQVFCLVKFDTTGNAEWILPTNASMTPELQFFNEKIRIQGFIARSGGGIIVRDSIIMPSVGFNNRFIMDVKLDGTIDRVFNIFQNNNSGTPFNMQTVGNLHNNQIYFLVQTTNALIQPGNNKLTVNGQVIEIPFQITDLLIKADSNLNGIQYKVLNQSGRTLLDLTQDRLSINETGDSLFLLLNNINFFVNEYFNITTVGDRHIVTFDTMLVTRSVDRLSKASVPGAIAKTNFYRQLHINGAKYYFGVFRGLNQVKAPSGISPNFEDINIFKNLYVSLDLNGPSKSFIVKEAPFQQPQVVFLGDHAVYEEDYIRMQGFEAIANCIMFTNPIDDRFNPWYLDLDLNIHTGAMIGLTDKTETILGFQYFEDGSKFAFGSAVGKTIFEEQEEMIASTAKPDLFFTVLNPDNTVKKYHRLFSSFRSINLLKQVKKGNKMYLLYNFAAPRNQIGKNFIIIGDDTHVVQGDFSFAASKTGYKLLFIIDEEGNLNYRDFYDLPIGPATAFDVYDNEDILVVSVNQIKSITVNGISFPDNEGFFAARIDAQNSVKQALKIYNTINPKPLADNIQLMPGEHDFIISTSFLFLGTVSSATLNVVLAGGSVQTTNIFNQYPGASSSQGYNAFHKLSFTNVLNSSSFGPALLHYPSMQTVSSHGFYTAVYNASGSRAAFRYNGIEVDSSTAPGKCQILKIDFDLQLKESITFNSIGPTANIEFIPLKLFENKGHVYAAGRQNHELKFGPIVIPYEGESDGMVLKFDSSLNLLKFFGLQSLNFEHITDIDIYKDSLIAFAAVSNANPNFIFGPLDISMSNGLKREDLGQIHFLGNVPIQDFPSDLIITKQPGNWHDPNTWTTGMVPPLDARVVIKHKVQISEEASCKTVFMDASGQIHVEDGVVFRITGEGNN